MPEASAHRQFFGDAERNFRLTPELIVELERKAGAGIGGLSRRFFNGDFRHQELLEVVRLGLIGGGERPEIAASLVAAYAAPAPVMELYGLALPIIETVMFGSVQSIANDLPGEHREAAE
ncbi:gene transfer agent family protein [Mesorhizobium sp. WSM2239]|uniref:Gene transfer agent family protein n=2 Tax=unclassified Mesorhizobium TaxID=325217 RepID=A0AAU8D3S1_9HYPH